jgi:hypothetical protein
MRAPIRGGPTPAWEAIVVKGFDFMGIDIYRLNTLLLSGGEET